MDFTIVQDLMDVVNGIKAGSVAAVGGALTIAIRLYRMIPKAPWPPAKWSFLVPAASGLVGFVASLLTGIFGFKMGIPEALSASFGVAVNAAGFDSVTKSLSKALPGALDPESKPGFFRRAFSFLLPLPKTNK